MTGFASQLLGLIALVGVGYLFFYRPVKAMLEASNRKMEEQLYQARLLAETLKEARASIDLQVKDAGTRLDLLRTAAVDLVRQEVRSAVARETKDLAKTL